MRIWFGSVTQLAVALLGGALLSCQDNGLGVPPEVCSTHAVDEGESSLMEPGGDCIGCHSSGEGPSFLLAGTVMAAAHDDTNCAGVADATVRITGADGAQLEFPTNSTGNFFARMSAGSIAFPYRAEVSRGGKTVRMVATRGAGELNCASCHTAAGANAAPGRIVAP